MDEASAPPLRGQSAIVRNILVVLFVVGLLFALTSVSQKQWDEAGLTAVACLILLWGTVRVTSDGARPSIAPGQWDWTDVLIAFPAGLVIGNMVGQVVLSVLVLSGLSSGHDPLYALMGTGAVYSGSMFGCALLLVVRRGGSFRDIGWRLPNNFFWFPAVVVAAYLLFTPLGPPLSAAYIAADLSWSRFRGNWLNVAATTAGAFVVSFFVLGLIATVLTSAAPQEATAQCRAVHESFGGGVIFAIGAVSFFAPIAEETMFRGLTYGWLRRNLPVASAAALTGLIFGLFHRNVVLLIPLALFGMMLSLIRERSHSLLPTIVLHGTFNCLGVIGLLSASCQLGR